jgi:ParB family chromosome partitioning protein
MKKAGSLGKGLSSLIKRNDTTATEESLVENSFQSNNGFLPRLPIELITPNPYQPRAEMNPEKLVEMADSIREHGVIEPILVSRVEGQNNLFQLIAGERRWRASQLAGLKTIPAVIKDTTPQEMLELAVIENIQREDLNPLEEALAFEQLVNSFKLSHDEIAKKVGLSRPAIANKIRLLTLPEEIKRGLVEEKVSEGHARALLGLKDNQVMIATYKIILRDHLSVRALEELIRRLNKGQVRKLAQNGPIYDNKTVEVETFLKDRFGKSFNFTRSSKGGKIILPFRNDNELDNLLKVLS